MFDVVVANIQSDVLIGMVDLLCDRVAVGGFLVLSGVLLSECDTIERVFARLQCVHVESDGEWTSLKMRHQC